MSLKQRIHSFKIPLSPRGLRVARVVYFTLPLLAGGLIMNRTMAYEQRHRPEWIDEADPAAEALRTQQQLDALKAIANDSDARLP